MELEKSYQIIIASSWLCTSCNANRLAILFTILSIPRWSHWYNSFPACGFENMIYKCSGLQKDSPNRLVSLTQTGIWVDAYWVENCCGTKALERCCMTACFSWVRSNAVLQLYGNGECMSLYKCDPVVCNSKAKAKAAKSLALSAGCSVLMKFQGFVTGKQAREMATSFSSFLALMHACPQYDSP